VTDSWMPVFAIMITLDASAALLAFFVLRPMRSKYMKTLAA
jgi:MFS transporter, OFA family, oxalate/formate antiporter